MTLCHEQPLNSIIKINNYDPIDWAPEYNNRYKLKNEHAQIST